MHPETVAQPPGAYEPQVQLEHLSSLFAMSRPALLGGLAFAIVIAYLLLPLHDPVVVWTWSLTKVVLVAVRYRDALVFARDPRRDARIAHWQRRFGVGLALDALSWGLMTPLFTPTSNDLADGLMLAGTAGVAAAGVFSLSPHRNASLLFLGAMILPLVLMQFGMAGRIHVFVALSFLIFGGVMGLECLKSHARFQEMARLRFANAAIAEQRQRALRLAEHSSAAKSRFLASVSHELRTPLNGIIGMTQFLADEPLSPTQRERLAVLRHSAEHLVTVIGDLLDLSRIEFDRIELQPRPARIEEVVRDVTDLLQPLAHERGLEFHLEFDPALPRAAVLDASRVKQVLHNLIGNALKFTAQGEIQVRVSCKHEQLRFDVLDTGEGIAPADVIRIFDAFEQAARHVPVRAGAGTGLGLTISRRLARAMGGDVICRSRPGAGARFRFTIAFEPAPQLPPPREVASTFQALSDEIDTLPPLGGHVLVVEDNEVNALVVTAMLTQMGMSFEQAGDGQQALARLAQDPPFDLVLMDCQMPRMDGWEATQAWRAAEAADPGARRLVIVALTASAAAGEREHCLQAGMDDYLTKPFTRQALAELLQRWLGP